MILHGAISQKAVILKSIECYDPKNLLDLLRPVYKFPLVHVLFIRPAGTEILFKMSAICLLHL
jgi:hypothetical protein